MGGGRGNTFRGPQQNSFLKKKHLWCTCLPLPVTVAENVGRVFFFFFFFFFLVFVVVCFVLSAMFRIERYLYI